MTHAKSSWLGRAVGTRSNGDSGQVASAAARVAPLRPGEELSVDGDHARTLSITSTARRNWSLTALGTLSDAPVFIKQFITANGRSDEKGAAAEAASAHRLSALAIPGFSVMTPLSTIASRVCLIYPQLDFRPIDQQLRSSSGISDTEWRFYCQSVRYLIDALLAPEGSDRLPNLKQRAPEGAKDVALCFKGLECRNTAIAGESILLFDLGPSYYGTAREAAGRLLVSCLLLNWGQPLRRFAAGPPRHLYLPLVDALNPYVDLHLVRRELAMQVRSRIMHPQARSRHGRIKKRLGLAALGIPYALRALRIVHMKTGGTHD